MYCSGNLRLKCSCISPKILEQALHDDMKKRPNGRVHCVGSNNVMVAELDDKVDAALVNALFGMFSRSSSASGGGGTATDDAATDPNNANADED